MPTNDEDDLYDAVRHFRNRISKQISINNMTTEHVIKEVTKELERAQAKFTAWPTDVIHAASIVNEESGELIRAALQYHYENGDIEELRKEAIQTAAMCVRFLKNFNSYHS